MSHFTVLVIGPDHEKQLAPFHEFECTGEVDQYVQDVDETDDARESYDRHLTRAAEGGESAKSFADFVKDYYDYPTLAHGEEPDIHDDHKWGYIRLDADGEVAQVIRRTNSNKKWDWYQVGGRWQGFFKLKEGAAGELGDRSLLMDGAALANTADILTKGAVDWDGMRAAAAAEAGATYDKVFEVLAGRPLPEAWDVVRDRHPDSIEAAREEYHAQETLKVLREADLVNFLGPGPGEEFLCTREEYMQRAADRVGVTFAVVKDGQWYEKGDMGWFGCVADEKDQNVWNAEFRKLIDGLPDDTPLTVVDCHI